MKAILTIVFCTLMVLTGQAQEAFLGENGKYGFKDKTGKEIIPPKYDYEPGNFSEDFAWIRLKDKYELIDKTGKIVISNKYADVQDFKEGLAAVTINGEADGFSSHLVKGWGFIDKTGKVVIPLKEYWVKSFSEGLAVFESPDPTLGKGVMDKVGKIVIPAKYRDIEDFKNGIAKVRLDGKFGFIDKTGKEIIAPKYDDIGEFSEGLVSVSVGGEREGYYDEWSGERYEYYTGGKWGFIENTGKEIIPLKYDKVSSFSQGKAKVELDGREFYIDKTGKEIK